MRKTTLNDFRDFEINDSEDNMHSVWDRVQNRWITPYQMDEAGHMYVDVRTNDGIRTVKPLHNLIAQAFLEKPTPDCDVVHHINENPSDNRLENLMWMTRPEHARLHWSDEGFRTKMSEALSGENHPNFGKFGKDNPTSKAVVQLTKDDEFVKRWGSIIDVERELGYAHQSISKCSKGKRKTCGGYKWVYESDYYPQAAVRKQPIQLKLQFNEAI